MDIQQIMDTQFAVDEAKTPRPEQKDALARVMNRWAENSRKYGIVQRTVNFNRGM